MKRMMIWLLCALLMTGLLACSKDTQPSVQPSQPTAGQTMPTTQPTASPTTQPETEPETEPDTQPTGPSYPFDEEEASHLFGLWQTETVLDGAVMGLPKLKDSFKLTVYFEFDDLGQVYTYVEKAAAEKAFSGFFSKKTVIKQVKDSCYALLKDQGYSQKEADKYIQDTYGKTMDQYVQMTIENLKAALNFEGMSTSTYYYAEGDLLYVLSADGESWEEYTVDVRSGKMTIQKALSPDGSFFLIDGEDDLPKKLQSVGAEW